MKLLYEYIKCEEKLWTRDLRIDLNLGPPVDSFQGRLERQSTRMCKHLSFILEIGECSSKERSTCLYSSKCAKQCKQFGVDLNS